MKDYIVSICLYVEAESKLDAKRKFWEIVDDDDYQVNPKVEKQEQ